MLVLMVPRVRVHKNSTDIALDVFKRCSVAVKVKAYCSISHRKKISKQHEGAGGERKLVDN